VGDGGGGHWLVRMEWRPAGWSMCLPVLIFPCTIKSRGSFLSPAHPGGHGKGAIKRLCGVVCLTACLGGRKNFGKYIKPNNVIYRLLSIMQSMSVLICCENSIMCNYVN